MYYYRYTCKSRALYLRASQKLVIKGYNGMCGNEILYMLMIKCFWQIVKTSSQRCEQAEDPLGTEFIISRTSKDRSFKKVPGMV